MSLGLLLAVIFSITLMGGLLPLLLIQSRKLFSPAVAFAAGLLVGTALFHLLPHAIPILGARIGWPIVLGFIIFYLPQKYMMVHPCEEEDCDYHSLGLLAFIGIAFHAVVDGIGVGAAYSFPETVGVVVAAVTMHKVSASVALSFLLLASGMERGRVITLLVLFALATPLGAIATKTVLIETNREWMGWALGFATGNFLAIAGSDLFRHIHQKDQFGRTKRIAFIFFGFVVSLLIGGLH